MMWTQHEVSIVQSSYSVSHQEEMSHKQKPEDSSQESWENAMSIEVSTDNSSVGGVVLARKIALDGAI